MGLFKWLFGPKEVHVRLSGTVNINHENLQLNSGIENKAQTDGPGLVDHTSDVELEPEIEKIQLPEVEFGEDVET